jgi:VWFA-related protein
MTEALAKMRTMLTQRSVFLAVSITAVLMFVVGTCQAGFAQQMIPIASQAAANESNSSSRTIWISAQSKDGTPRALSISDLEVKIDGKPASVRDVRPLSPALHYCLLLDISSSTRSTRNTQREIAVALLSKIPKASRDYGLLVAFNDQAYLDAEGTDPQKLIKSIQQDARGATAMYDAMVACSDHLSKNDSAPDTPRVMFVLSDGVDNASRTFQDEAERTLIRERIRVYSIREKFTEPYQRTAEVARENKSLRQLVESTGGKNYLLTKEVTLDRIVQDISADLSGLYAVALISEKTVPPGHVCKLEVRCGKKDCAVTAPREYFVPLH